MFNSARSRSFGLLEIHARTAREMIKLSNTNMINEYGIVANFTFCERFWRRGGLVYILNWHGGFDRPQIISMTKGGKYVIGYSAFKRLENFRIKWSPPHIREHVIRTYSTKDEANIMIEDMAKWGAAQVHSYRGILQRIGKTESQVLGG